MSEKLPTTGQAYSFNTDSKNRPLYYTYDREDPKPKPTKTRLSEQALLESVTIPEKTDREWYEDGVSDQKKQAELDAASTEKLETKGFPKSASWSSLYNGDFQAKVLGKYENGLYLIELAEELNGSLRLRVPEEELVIVEDRMDEPETPQASGEVSDSSEVRALKQEIAELRNMVTSLQATIEDLRRELAEAKGTAPDAEAAETAEDDTELEFPIGSRVRAENKKGEIKDNWIVASKPEKNRKGEEGILLVNIEGELLTVSPENLRKWNSEGFAPPAGEEESAVAEGQTSPAEEIEEASAREETEEPENKRTWGWLQRAKDAKYTAPMAVIGFFKGERILGEDDPNWSEEEKEKRRKRRAVVRTLGIAAVFGAGVLTGFLLDSDDGSKDIINNQHTDINNHLNNIDSQLDGISDQLQDHDHSVETQHDLHDDNMTGQHEDNQSHETGNGGGSGGSGEGGQTGLPGENDGDGQNGGGGSHEEGAGSVETGASFKVEYGNGVTHEIQQYAEHNGIHISDQDAFRIYEQIEQTQGSRILDLHGTPVDSYWYTDPQSGPEVRIASPGTASWYPEAESQLKSALGLG